jgi:hypothetical protein
MPITLPRRPQIRSRDQTRHGRCIRNGLRSRRHASTRRPASVIRMCATMIGCLPAPHALGLYGCEPGADPLNQQLDRKTVCQHDCLGAAIRATGE